MVTLTYNAHLEGRSAALSFDGLALAPGANQIAAADLRRLRLHPDFGRYIEAGLVVVHDESDAGASPAPVPFLVNLNTAKLSALVALPRIGERGGRKLIAARPIASLEDARLATGLSPERWADVAPFVEV